MGIQSYNCRKISLWLQFKSSTVIWGLQARLWKTTRGSRRREAPSCCIFADSLEIQGALMTAAAGDAAAWNGRDCDENHPLCACEARRLLSLMIMRQPETGSRVSSQCHLKHSAAAQQTARALLRRDQNSQLNTVLMKLIKKAGNRNIWWWQNGILLLCNDGVGAWV